MNLKHRLIKNVLFQRDTATQKIILTTSLIVAKRFGKQHVGGVCKKIHGLRIEDFRSFRRHFWPVEYIDENGEYRGIYLMDKDGFSILADRFECENDPLVDAGKFLDRFEAEEQLRAHRKGIRSDIRKAIKHGDRSGLYCHRGVFEALRFAIQNPGEVGIDKNSKEYLQIQRAYWGMPWALEGFERTLRYNLPSTTV